MTRTPNTVEAAGERVDHIRRLFVYRWGNNEKRAQLKGRRCVVEARGAKGTVLLRFIDTGERVTTSRRAITPAS